MIEYTAMSKKAGFVAIVGRCNTGKSTLLNAILNHKVSIISPVPQTTRHQVRGIYTDERGQIVFVDTPGINLIRFPLAKRFNNTAFTALQNVDAVLYVVDIHDKIGQEERVIIDTLKEVSKPVVVALNKKDKGKGFVNAYIEETKDIAKYFIPVSAIRGEGVDEVIDALFELLPPADHYYYPEHMKTDFPLKLFVAEVIREKFLNLLREEIPHYLTVVVEEIKEERPDLIYIKAVIITKEHRHKGIIIGKEGQLIKTAGTKARKELKLLFGKKVHLDLWVKVDEDWMSDPDLIRELGYAM